MRLAVLGCGYVGTVVAACLAHLGHQVAACDVDRDRVRRLAAGDPVVLEPGLAGLLQAGLASGRLWFTGDPAAALAGARAAFVCVGTPPRPDGRPDRRALIRAVAAVARHARQDLLLVIKSTTPVGTAALVQRHLRRVRPGLSVAANPEFLREGQAVADFLAPSRSVLGVFRPEDEAVLRAIYAPIQAPVLVTDPTTAEILKYASNAFLATKIAFINLMADLCEAAGGDVAAVAQGMGLDPRIGPHYLGPGLGYGGPCLPKDVQALAHAARRLGADPALLEAVDRANRSRVDRMLARIRAAVPDLPEQVVALWGLSFKPGTGDVRGSPALPLARGLLAQGARLRLWDPMAAAAMAALLPPEPGRVEYSSTPLAAAQGAVAAVVVTAWPELADLPLDQLARAMARPVVLDGRNAFDPAAMAAAGFAYYPTGRRPSGR